MFPPEGSLYAFGIPLRGSCWFRTLGVLAWRGVLGRGRLESYWTLSGELVGARIDPVVALLGTGATMSGIDTVLPIPAKATE